MTTINFLVRFVVTLAFLFFLVWWWAGRVYLGELPLDIKIASMFFSDEPIGGTRNLLIVARAFFGLSLAAWAFIPSLELFADVDFAVTARSFAGVLVLLSAAAFFGAIVWQTVYGL